MELICKMSPKIRLICKWVPNLPQIIRKWTSFANESQFICKWVLICKWGVSSTWVMNSFANEMWLICKWVQYWFICKWVLTHLQTWFHLQMSLKSFANELSLRFANEPFPSTFFLLYFLPQHLLPKIVSRHNKNTHTHRTSHPTSTEHHCHGGAVCCYSSMAVANHPALPPGASS